MRGVFAVAITFVAVASSAPPRIYPPHHHSYMGYPMDDGDPPPPETTLAKHLNDPTKLYYVWNRDIDWYNEQAKTLNLWYLVRGGDPPYDLIIQPSTEEPFSSSLVPLPTRPHVNDPHIYKEYPLPEGETPPPNTVLAKNLKRPKEQYYVWGWEIKWYNEQAAKLNTFYWDHYQVTPYPLLTLPTTQRPLDHSQQSVYSTQTLLFSTQEPSASTQEPSASTQEPLASTQEPLVSTKELSYSTQESAYLTLPSYGNRKKPTHKNRQPSYQDQQLWYQDLNGNWYPNPYLYQNQPSYYQVQQPIIQEPVEAPAQASPQASPYQQLQQIEGPSKAVETVLKNTLDEKVSDGDAESSGETLFSEDEAYWRSSATDHWKIAQGCYLLLVTLIIRL